MDAIPNVIARLTEWRAAMLAGAAGAASVLAMAPFFVWPILFITFPVLMWLFDGAAIRAAQRSRISKTMWRTSFAQGAFIGWAFGFGYFLASIYWIGHAFLVEADRYAISMPFAVIGLCASLGIFHGVAGGLTAIMWRCGPVRIVGFAIAFFTAELARGHILTGFPWNLFGYALTADEAVMQGASVVGVYGLTLAALFVFASPAAVAAPAMARQCRRSYAPVALSVAVLAGAWAWGTWRLGQNTGELVPGVNLRIVQPNIPQAEKWKPENRRWIFERLVALSRSGSDGTDISDFTHVFWPESSVPFLFVFNNSIRDPTARQLLADLVPRGTMLVLGAERADGTQDADGRLSAERVYNSLFVLDAEARLLETYDKTHLVPFGEYVPFRNLLAAFGLGAFSHRLEGFDAGLRRFAIDGGAAPPFAPLICYEIIFPGRAVPQGERPSWLVNVTNDAWFGDSTGPHQHLQLARVRAVEEGLPVVRSANTGVSSIIDAYGKIRSKLELNVSGVIDHGLPRSLHTTLFAKYHNKLLLALILFSLLIYFAMVSRQGRE